MEQLNDNELLYLVLQGSEIALKVMMDSYRQFFKMVLRNYYSHLIHCFGEEDALQEGLCVVSTVLERYRGDSSANFKTYARQCAEKRWCSLIRKTYTYKEKANQYTISLEEPLYQSNQDDFSLPMENILADSFVMRDPKGSLYIQEKLENIQRVIKESKGKYDADITYLKMIGYSDQEIADHLQITTKKVANAIYHIRKKFDFNKH